MPLLREELEASDNPFDWAPYAGVCALLRLLLPYSCRQDKRLLQHYLCSNRIKQGIPFGKKFDCALRVFDDPITQ
jgi:hypothetical protein